MFQESRPTMHSQGGAGVQREELFAAAEELSLQLSHMGQQLREVVSKVSEVAARTCGDEALPPPTAHDGSRTTTQHIRNPSTVGREFGSRTRTLEGTHDLTVRAWYSQVAGAVCTPPLVCAEELSTRCRKHCIVKIHRKRGGRSRVLLRRFWQEMPQKLAND